MNITIVGLGLIGGSLAYDLSTQLNVSVYGVDHQSSHCDKAMELGLVDRIITMDLALEISDIIILAIPVDVISPLLSNILDDIQNHQIVTDVGSTKLNICNAIKNHPQRSRFVAAHPLAGTEYSGPEAAVRGLFRGKKNIIVERDRSDADAIDIVSKLFESVGMNTYYLSAEEHDRHLAYVSHLSHITSFALGLTVLNIEKDENQIFNLASTGFSSTARLAKSNPNTWSAIFANNKEHLINALSGYERYLKQFKEAIINNDEERLVDLMVSANEIKKILE